MSILCNEMDMKFIEQFDFNSKLTPFMAKDTYLEINALKYQIILISSLKNSTTISDLFIDKYITCFSNFHVKIDCINVNTFITTSILSMDQN